MEARENIAGIPVKDLKKLAIKYIGNDSHDSQQQIALKINIAKCARLSYMTFDNKIDYEKDIKLHDHLLDSKHMSPFEHCAMVMDEYEYERFHKGELELHNADVVSYWTQDGNEGWCNNFRGFIPYRYLIESS